jgi:hypothetical protein
MINQLKFTFPPSFRITIINATVSILHLQLAIRSGNLHSPCSYKATSKLQHPANLTHYKVIILDPTKILSRASITATILNALLPSGNL